MAYATVDELAAALRIRVTPENTAGLQACLDAAALEIDTTIDRIPVVPPTVIAPDTPAYALVNRVNIVRGVEFWKANDAAFGVIGLDEAGALQAPRDGFRRHEATLLPLKEQFGIA